MKYIIPLSRYFSMSYDDLLVYSLYILKQENRPSTFENLVAKSFELFPKRFQLPGYSHWPDSSLVEKSWLRCRTDKGLINGNKSKGFVLTEKGEALVKIIRDKFLNGSNNDYNTLIKGDTRTKSGRVVKHIEESLAYDKYLKDKNLSKITDFEFCDLLYTTLDTKPSLRRRNLSELRYHADVYEREDILKFLRECEVFFEKLLRDPLSVNYEGGMMRKKKL